MYYNALSECQILSRGRWCCFLTLVLGTGRWFGDMLECHCESVLDAWMTGWMDGWMDKEVNGWIHGCVDGWIDGWVCERSKQASFCHRCYESCADEPDKPPLKRNRVSSNVKTESWKNKCPKIHPCREDSRDCRDGKGKSRAHHDAVSHPARFPLSSLALRSTRCHGAF